MLSICAFSYADCDFSNKKQYMMDLNINCYVLLAVCLPREGAASISLESYKY